MKALLLGVVVGGALVVVGRAAHARYVDRRRFTAVTEEAARIRLEQAAFRRALDVL